MEKQHRHQQDTMLPKVILASSSEVRKKILRKYFSTVVVASHQVEEDKYKTVNNKPEEIALKIAKAKAYSIVKDYSNDMIIASDQILVCENQILSKPKNQEEAIKKLLFLKNKTHRLYSAIYVIRKKKFYFQQVKEASLFFIDLSLKDIESYVRSNEKTVVSTVGSYKIEENSKYNFIRIIEGDLETILGFPITDLIEKIKYEK